MTCPTCWKRWTCILECPEVNAVLVAADEKTQGGGSVTKAEMKAWMTEAISLARIKVQRSGKPYDVLGLVDGVKLSFFAMSSKLPTADFLELDDEINRLQTKTFRELGI